MIAPGPHRQAFCLTLLALVVYFTLGSRVLMAAGVPYSEEGGSLIFKLHPGTYLLTIACMVRLSDKGMPIYNAWRIVWREKLLAFYVGAIFFCMVSESLLTGAGGLVMLLDTFMPAGMIAIALCDMSAVQVAVLASLLRMLLVMNATIALGETVAGTHFVADTDSLRRSTTEFRAVALYDHPLTGAAATMLGLRLCPDLRPKWFWPAAYTALMFAALVSFGGRIAFALAIAGGVWLQGRRMTLLILSRCVRAADLLPVLLAISVAGVTLLAALAQGFGNRLLAHLYWDASAQTRLSEFHLFDRLRPEQILFGCRREDMIALLEPMRLEFGVDAVESFWLVMLVILGVFAFPIFVLAFAALLKWLWDRGDAEGQIIVASMVVAVSSSNSLGHKSALMVMLVAAVMARVPIVREKHFRRPSSIT